MDAEKYEKWKYNTKCISDRFTFLVKFKTPVETQRTNQRQRDKRIIKEGIK